LRQQFSKHCELRSHPVASLDDARSFELLHIFGTRAKCEDSGGCNAQGLNTNGRFSMRTKRTNLMPALLTASLAISAVLANSLDASAGDQRSKHPMSGLPNAATTTKVGNQVPEPKPYIPPRPAGLKPGDQIDLVYDARTKSYGFGFIKEIRKAGQPSETPTATIVHDHRGKTAKPPSTPPGSPPPAAPPSAVLGPPAAPPGTISTPPASGNVVRNHVGSLNGNGEVTTYKVHDHREGYGGDTYEVKSFKTATGETVTVKPRQKPPCYGNACWFFGR
jgi:hypothetical protein